MSKSFFEVLRGGLIEGHHGFVSDAYLFNKCPRNK